MKHCLKSFVSICTSKVGTMLNKFWKFITGEKAIAIASMIVAVIAVVVSYYTLKESVRQRETMYRPAIFVEGTSYYADLTDSTGIKYYRIERGSILKSQPVSRPSFNLINVGLGCAMHVEISADFRPSMISSELNALKIRQNNRVHSWDTFVHGNDSLVLGLGAIEKLHRDYILPVSQAQDVYNEEITIQSFNSIIESALWLNSIKGDTFQGYLIPIDLNYYDINGKLYEEKTFLQIRCFTDKGKNGIRCYLSSGLAQKRFMEEMDMLRYGME